MSARAHSTKPKRPYNAGRRREQALRTREDILEAARGLFLANGYAGTSLAAVAEAAGVSVDTVYKAYRNKSGLFRAIMTVAIRGGEDVAPLRQSEAIQAIRAEPDPRRKLERYGALLAVVNPRVAPIARVLREAAAGDPELSRMWNGIQSDRLEGMSEFAAHLQRTGALREGVSRPAARDVLWALGSPDLFDLLVGGRGWSAKRYGAWVAEQMTAALLPRPMA